MSVVAMTVEELVQTIRRSRLPTIVCEGKTDVAFYRQLENRIGPTVVSVLPTQGRSTLLKVYERRDEFRSVKVVFFADADFWLFHGVPSTYSDIELTSGFSIENDLLAPSPVESLLSTDEQVAYRRSLENVVRWFAFVVESVATPSPKPCDNVAKVLDASNNLCPLYSKTVAFSPASHELTSDLLLSYRTKLRGKTWVELLLRFLSAGKRASKFSERNLLELGCKTWGETLLRDREKLVRQKLCLQ